MCYNVSPEESRRRVTWQGIQMAVLVFWGTAVKVSTDKQVLVQYYNNPPLNTCKNQKPCLSTFHNLLIWSTPRQTGSFSVLHGSICTYVAFIIVLKQPCPSLTLFRLFQNHRCWCCLDSNKKLLCLLNVYMLTISSSDISVGISYLLFTFLVKIFHFSMIK